MQENPFPFLRWYLSRLTKFPEEEKIKVLYSLDHGVNSDNYMLLEIWQKTHILQMSM